MQRLIAVVLFLGLLVSRLSFALPPLNEPGSAVKVYAQAESGAVKVLANTIQFGPNTTMFDYVEQGGEDILFPYQRYSVALEIADRHTVTFLYQPLTLTSTTKIPASVTGGITIEDTPFPAGTPLDLKYGFDFWRASYTYDFLVVGGFRLGAGASLQLRNASIVFDNGQGTSRTVSQNLGPVPILRLTTRYDFGGGPYLSAVADGFYASSALFNGAGFDFEGWIYDASISAGTAIGNLLEPFLTVRLLGGGARGTSRYTTRWTETPSGYTNNVLTTLAVTLGVTVR